MLDDKKVIVERSYNPYVISSTLMNTTGRFKSEECNCVGYFNEDNFLKEVTRKLLSKLM